MQLNNRLILCSLDIELQVWRPSAKTANSSDRYFTKVGANFFKSVNITTPLIPRQQIEVIPGDVLGIRVLNHDEGDDEKNECENQQWHYFLYRRWNGIIFLSNINNERAKEEVWYARISGKINGPVSIGPGGILNKSLNAAPVISVYVRRHLPPSTDPNTVLTDSPNLANSKTHLATVVANISVAVILIVVTAMVVMACICFIVRRKKAQVPALRTSQERVGKARDSTRNTYSEGIVSNVRRREETAQIQRVQEVDELTREIRQMSNAKVVTQEANVETSGSENRNQAEASRSNTNRIPMKFNEAYGCLTDNVDYENLHHEYEFQNDYHEYDYI